MCSKDQFTGGLGGGDMGNGESRLCTVFWYFTFLDTSIFFTQEISSY